MTNGQLALNSQVPLALRVSDGSRPLRIGTWSFFGHWSFFPRRFDCTGEAEGPRPAAFTLIELILVMAVLAIVLAVSAPALSNFFRGRALDSEARRFVSLTRYGQSRAVSEGVPMILWMKPRLGAYGLQEEPGYTEADHKVVNFELGKDLRIEVADVPLPLPSQSGQSRQTLQTDPNVPRLRFQPDGFIDETSPQSVIIREGNGASIWITQSRNRLHYEISTNSFQNALR
jgi:prepilin-type N-terminal cleavage/methylation domain-containing protein